jgi:hypothetical protein
MVEPFCPLSKAFHARKIPQGSHPQCCLRGLLSYPPASCSADLIVFQNSQKHSCAAIIIG